MKGHLHHIEIYVSDVTRSSEFWGWLLGELGYEKGQEWSKGVNFIKGETYLTFSKVKNKYNDMQFNRCGVGLNHLAFHADSREMVDELTVKLENRGYSILYKDKHPFAGGENHYAVFFEDPDRIKVEVAAPDTDTFSS